MVLALFLFNATLLKWFQVISTSHVTPIVIYLLEPRTRKHRWRSGQFYLQQCHV